MPFEFNKKLWTLGREIEDEIKPHLEKFLECDFERRDDIYDVLDFHSPEDKKIVEVKGRTCDSDKWETTIITCNKITEGLMEMEKGWEVWYFFVFRDKTMYLKLDPDDCDFNMKYTGTNRVPHYLIPVDRLTEFEGQD
jgi:hypothetical protein